MASVTFWVARRNRAGCALRRGAVETSRPPSDGSSRWMGSYAKPGRSCSLARRIPGAVPPGRRDVSMPQAAAADSARPVLVVPREALQPLRESVYGEICRVAEVVLEATQSADRSLDRASFLRRRAEVERACALLDEIGWTRMSVRSARRVDILEHRVILLTALRAACADAEHVLEDVTAGRQNDPDKTAASIRRAALMHELLAVVANAISGSVRRQGRALFRSQPQAQEARQSNSLTPREKEVLKRLADGQKYAEIAAVLHIQIETVRTHARQIRRKLGVRASKDLIGWSTG